MSSLGINSVTVARQAMATRFEVAMHGRDPVSLRAAAEEALDEVQRVEAMLSWRMATSQVAQINARAGAEPVRVNPEMFQLLQTCRDYWKKSGGTFDITVGPLMQAYGFHRQDQQPNDEANITSAREACGMNFLELNGADLTVRFQRAGMRLDFGAIGKGYAIDLAVEILRDVGIESALIHGGTSTLCAIGAPPDSDAWKIAVEYPPGDDPDETLPVLSVLPLRDGAMSVSAVWGRVFKVGEDTFGHVIDPRTGAPAQRALLSIWTSESATEADAFSTALLTEGVEGIERLGAGSPAAKSLVLAAPEGDEQFVVRAAGIQWEPPPTQGTRISPLQ